MHSSLFWGWIVDDAGISFAYARNLALGHGLVSQPGVAPVEGYSNPTWVALLVPFFAAGLFNPVVTPKVISLVLVFLSFRILFRTVERVAPASPGTSQPGAFGGLALLLLSLNTPFVVWTTSGLENPLYVFLLCLLLEACCKALHEGNRLRIASSIAVLAAAAALTRPEGVLFAFVFPVIVVMALGLNDRSREEVRSRLRQLGAYAATFGAIYGGFILFRLLYFGALQPNTYYAKEGTGSADLIGLVTFKPAVWLRIVDATGSISTGPGQVIAFLLIFLLIWRAVRIRNPMQCVVATFLVVGLAILFLLPTDWMEEKRFATPFVVFFYVLLVVTGADVISDLKLPRRAAGMTLSLIAAFLVVGSVQFGARSIAFSEDPTVPLEFVRYRYAERFHEYTVALRISDGSVLLPDVGATLLYSDLRVYDLAGLVDRTIAKTLRKNPQAFYDYIFDQAQPTFVHTHDWWASSARLDNDARFRRDYAPICEGIDAKLFDDGGQVIYTGDYVRRDALGSPSEVQALSHLCEKYVVPGIWR